MRIISQERPDDCVTGGLISDYRLDAKVSNEFVDYLRSLGKVNVLDGMEKPFYTFEKAGHFTIKGVVGTDRIKVIYRKEDTEHLAKVLERMLSGFKPSVSHRARKPSPNPRRRA
jgi:hypothetical protein